MKGNKTNAHSFIIIFFILTLTFSLVSASSIIGNTPVSIDAYAKKSKKSSGGDGGGGSGDSSSDSSKGSSDNKGAKEGDKTNQGTNDNNNNNQPQPSNPPIEQQTPDQSSLTTTQQAISPPPLTPPDCTTNPNDPACQTQQVQPPSLPGLVPTPLTPSTCHDGTQSEANGKCPTTILDNNTGGEGNGGGSKVGGGILGVNNTISNGDNGTVLAVGAGNRTLQNITNVVSNANLTNTSKTLSLSISVAKNPIVRGNIQIITVTVSDKESYEKVSGADVKVVVTYASGLTTKQFSGSTDSSGRAPFPWRIGGDSNAGVFKVEVRVSKDGYTSASGKTSFNVICDTLSRGCPPPHPPPHPPPRHGGSSSHNYVGSSPSLMQQLKYFKEFTDTPANSPLYITSTSMHKDTLGDIITTGELKNRGTTTANFVEIIATFYNTNNQTLGNKNTFTEPTTLQPGQAAPFTIYLSPKDIPLKQINSVKYHLNWQYGASHTTANKVLPKTGSLKTTSSSPTPLK